MKLKVLMTVAVLLLSTSAAFGQSGVLTLDNVVGLFNTDTLDASSSEVVFNVRTLNNTGVEMTGFTIGLRVYSPDGATWGTTAADTLADLQGFYTVFTFDPNSVPTGSGADTVGFNGLVFGAGGMPGDYDSTALSVRIGPLNLVDHMKTICIDSSFYRPTGVWKWAAAGSQDFFPTWDGPHCFTVWDENTAVRIAGDGNVPKSFALGQNYPNPFNPTTQIAFDLPVRSQVELKVYNVLGQEVTTLVNEKLGAGSYEADWDGRSNGGSEVASGIYFYRLHTEAFTQTKKMILLK